MSNFALNDPYRKAHEAKSALAATVCVVALAFTPIDTPTKLALSIGLMTLALIRLRQASKIWAHHKNLRQLQEYALTAAQIPVSPLALFLGKGFRWDQTHTQRLALARDPKNLELSRPSALYKRAREFEIHNPKHWLAQFTRSKSWLNPVIPRPPVGGDTVLHGVEINEEDVWLDIGERVGHMLVLGTTRVGKTRLAETMITQDIHRGDVTIVFDPKGDGDMFRTMWAESKRAGRPFYMFHLGFPEESARYNPISSYSRITEVATRIANQLPGDGQSAAFKEFVWRFLNVIAKTMEALSIKPSYENIYASATNIDDLAQKYMEQWLSHNDKNWEEKIEGLGFDNKDEERAKRNGRKPDVMRLAQYISEEGHIDAVCNALISVLNNDRDYFAKLVSSLYPLLEKLTTGKVSELLSPDSSAKDSRPIFDWMSVIQTKAVVYVGLDSLSDYEVAGAVGNAMFSDLTSIAGQIYKHGTGYGESGIDQSKTKIAIHADEFNELIGDEFIPLLNKAGGAGYQVTVYTQTWSDVEAKIGSAAKAGQIGGNLNNLIMLRVKNTETAEILTNQLPEVNVVTTTQLSGVSDIGNPEDFEDFATQNEDRVAVSAVPMITASDLVSLPKGQAFALIEGGQLYKIRMPYKIPDSDGDGSIPKNISEIARKMNGARDGKPTEASELVIHGEVYGD